MADRALATKQGAQLGYSHLHQAVKTSENAGSDLSSARRLRTNAPYCTSSLTFSFHPTKSKIALNAASVHIGFDKVYLPFGGIGLR